MVLLAGANKINETSAGCEIPVGAARAWPPWPPIGRTDASKAHRMHRMDEEQKLNSMKLNQRILFMAVLALLRVTPAGMAQSVKFTGHKLKNGLRVIVSEDHSAPTYSISVVYNAGSRDERPGRTGFAHLFEHMLFQGSENVGKGEHFILVQNNGGSANGTTNIDRTNYFETLPANQLELGIFLEADRMRAPAITQANFDNQRLTVQEERRQSYDNRPYGKTYEAVIGLAYDNFAYKHSTIGSMDDLNAATIEDAEAFFRTYYAPNNAVISMVRYFKTDVELGMKKKTLYTYPWYTP